MFVLIFVFERKKILCFTFKTEIFISRNNFLSAPQTILKAKQPLSEHC